MRRIGLNAIGSRKKCRLWLFVVPATICCADKKRQTGKSWNVRKKLENMQNLVYA